MSNVSQYICAAMVLVAAVAAADESEMERDPDAECPVTLGASELLQHDPGNPAAHLYGSEALAVALPVDGTWPVTAPGALIAVKLFWQSAGFRPGMEDQLRIRIVNLHDGPNDAVVKGITNANAEPADWNTAQFDDEWQAGWTMLAGIDFPSAGCWEITGEYLGQRLTFVAQTVAFSPAPAQ